MQLNKRYLPKRAAVQVNKPLIVLFSTFHAWDTMAFRELESVEQLEQDTEQTVPPFPHSSSKPSSRR